MENQPHQCKICDKLRSLLRRVTSTHASQVLQQNPQLQVVDSTQGDNSKPIENLDPNGQAKNQVRNGPDLEIEYVKKNGAAKGENGPKKKEEPIHFDEVPVVDGTEIGLGNIETKSRNAEIKPVPVTLQQNDINEEFRAFIQRKKQQLEAQKSISGK